MMMTACTDITGSGTLPNGTTTPTEVQNAAGAGELAVAAHYAFQQALGSFIVATGLLTDELQSNERGAGINDNFFGQDNAPLDARRDRSNRSDAVYTALHGVRTLSMEAIGALAKYDPSHSANRRGALYAMQGYAELYLADLFCSGVPLSIVDFEEDFTYKPSETTSRVYMHAIALFDTALTLAPDSEAVIVMARIGTGRALLALEQYAAAADTVRAIPTDAHISELVYTCNYGGCPFNSSTTMAAFDLAPAATVADSEGAVGIPFISKYDPRTTVEQIGTTQYGYTTYFPEKFMQGAASTLNVATGVEARLIEAEADLRSGGSRWLQILNELRTDGTVASVYQRTDTPGASPGPAGVQDTTWGPGTGTALIPAAVKADAGPQCASGNGGPPPVCADTVWYKGLHPLQDPGTPQSRADLIFTERAKWLFLTGHREGDLRRRIRDTDPVWRRAKATLYPGGAYPGIGVYGSAADAVIPDAEQINPYFRGCLARD
jgi:hypothetical protein